tara:strand:- start:1001 stop:1795 length:795 start_codon:yes stop_codon:yes gene_type:complete
MELYKKQYEEMAKFQEDDCNWLKKRLIYSIHYDIWTFDVKSLHTIQNEKCCICLDECSTRKMIRCNNHYAGCKTCLSNLKKPDCPQCRQTITIPVKPISTTLVSAVQWIRNNLPVLLNVYYVQPYHFFELAGYMISNVGSDESIAYLYGYRKYNSGYEFLMIGEASIRDGVNVFTGDIQLLVSKSIISFCKIARTVNEMIGASELQLNSREEPHVYRHRGYSNAVFSKLYDKFLPRIPDRYRIWTPNVYCIGGVEVIGDNITIL